MFGFSNSRQGSNENNEIQMESDLKYNILKQNSFSNVNTP